MQIYPAMRANMGDWNYYIVRMKMSEVAKEVNFAHDIHEDQTLGEAIQRTLRSSRVKKHIVSFLSKRPDRFFSSIVVAAIGGEPQWYGVEPDASVVPAMFAKNRALRESFGILCFGDEPKYYALDGQHRVSAIKHLLDRDSEYSTPPGFENDMLSVIVVLRHEHDMEESEWLRRYRRLFSSLNRYAKPTDKDTNIIMDEDDAFAILTRRLISEHGFFTAPGREKESFRVFTERRNLRKGMKHFTTLQILYEMNQDLLTTRQRENYGWTDDGLPKLNLQYRPDEAWLDARYEELSSYWDAIVAAMPVLGNPPEDMRRHDAKPIRDRQTDDVQDSFLFWPIGQLTFAKIVRSRLDHHFDSGLAPVEAMTRVLRPLGEIPWDLHGAPWRGLMLVQVEGKDGAWTMRNEGRKEAMDKAAELLHWMVGSHDLDDEAIAELRTTWRNLLLPQPTDAERDEMWATVVEARNRVLSSPTD